ncbi:MAG TPA: hypothetical protein VH081_07105 [Solirubrobacteraceae bacterium]|jgi:hypothetical protein|nr:hypothetical protein [Solirubrobacteraceae bacterium]
MDRRRGDPGPIDDRPRQREGYDTSASSVARLPSMVLALSKAVVTDIGLIAVFGGIGVIVNIIIVYIAVQIRGERMQNQEYREHLMDQ